MGLASCEVVVDTYNLRLAKGSGIKTYGVTLIDSLRRLGATISVLSDRVLPKQRNEVLDEVHFFDPPPIASLLPDRVRILVDALRLATGPQRPVPIQMRHVIQSSSHQPIAQADHIYNVSDVYDRSHRLYRLAGRRTTIDLGGSGGGGAGPGHRRLWHATTPLPIRVRGTPMITTVHDLIPLRLPYMTRDHKKTFYGIIDQALRDSCLVLAVSEFTKRDLLELFDVDESKVVVTWETYSPSVPLPESVDQTVVLRQHGLRPHEYLLYVGRVERGKGIPGLLEAYRSLRASVTDAPTLVLAGETSMDVRAEGVRVLGRVSEPEKWDGLAGALAAVVPSPRESLSLLALESFAVGTPVLGSAASPVVRGHVQRSRAGVTFEDPATFVDAVAEVRRERAALARSARRYAARYRWERVVAAYREEMDEMVKRR